MNSLTELNGYSSTTNLTYTDLRAATVIFDRAAPINLSQIVDEGFAFSTVQGIEILEVRNSAAANCTYTINISNLVGATLTWPTLPTGVTATTPGTGIYRLSGINDAIIWNAVKTASITMPNNYNGLWTYTGSIEYYDGLENSTFTKTFTVAVTVNDVLFLTTPSSFVYPVSATTIITNTPQIINVDVSYPGVTWTVIITPSATTSINTFTTTGTGGSFAVDVSTKVITISGTRTQVNSRLAGLAIDANSTSVDFSLSYNVVNSLNGTTDNQIQLLNSLDLVILNPVTVPTIYFIEDAAAFNVTGAPEISDKFYDGSGTYTYTITPSNTAAVFTMGTSGTSGTGSYNPNTKVITLTGTRAQVNLRLLTLTLKTTVDWDANFTLSYSVSTPRAETATKIQIFSSGSNDTEISNMNVSRNYTSNNSNSIFATTTPSITDFDTSESTYTFSFSSGIGLFGFGTETPVSTLTFTGTRAQCNAKYSTIKFYPNYGTAGNGTFTYVQLKNGIQQVSQSVALLGTSGSYTGSRTVFITTSQNWVPNPEDALYGKVSTLLLVGGGGGGGGGFAGSGFSYGGGGGGGGAVRYSATPFTLNVATSYPLVVGAGGLAGTSGNPATSGTQGQSTTAFGYTVVGGGGGFSGAGAGGSSGPGVGSAFQDDNGLAGGTAATSGTNRGGGGGGGHLSVNGWAFPNGTSSAGGRGSPGFDEPGGQNSFYGAGGGAGGPTGGAAGNASVSGSGANSTRAALASTLGYGGGGGGGGYGVYAAGNGTVGVVQLKLVAR